MSLLIKNGLVIDPANNVQAKLNILVDGGKVVKVTREEPEADEVIDATGKIVCPGFVDMHMHEDPVEDGRIYDDDENAIFHCMLRQGVTTVVAGNCGINVYHPADYMDIVDRDGAAVNVSMLAGHQFFREYAGAMDKYANASEEQIEKMSADIQDALDRGCAGVSYGIRYIPGTTYEEIIATAKPCQKDKKLVTSHVRDDCEYIFGAVQEVLDLGETLDIPVQISHIGSMGGFGQMERLLQQIDEARENGLDVMSDCYPYYAFSTFLGATTYDDGWLERYSCDYSAIELCEGKYKGQRCTKEIFDEMRIAEPNTLTVGFLMKKEDVDLAFNDPNVILGTDGLFSHGQGHPRAAGAFPHFLAEFVRPGIVQMYDAIAKMTCMAADRIGAKNKGRLNVGADADIVIFDPDKIADKATFQQPNLAPEGIDYVLIAGQIAAKDCKVVNGKLGRSVRV